MNSQNGLSKYGQYKADIFEKLNFDFQPGKKILDVGCGTGTDAEIFMQHYKLKTSAIDIYQHDNISKIHGLDFKLAGIYQIPFPDQEFDYVFAHDVLHHIDEEHQDRNNHLKGLAELARVTKKGGYIIILEGNRYNPLFYPHMVKICGHNHWSQKYFKNIIKEQFFNVEFKFFECHFYPKKLLKFFKLYERFMDKMMPKKILAYNTAIIKNE